MKSAALRAHLTQTLAEAQQREALLWQFIRSTDQWQELVRIEAVIAHTQDVLDMLARPSPPPPHDTVTTDPETKQ